MRDIDILLQKSVSAIRRGELPALPSSFAGYAGLSLCLFEISSSFKDEEIEDLAIGLLQKCVDSPPDTMDFHTGASGLGFVVLYLIQHRFIDADYPVFLRDQHQQIITFILESEQTASFCYLLPFLLKYQGLYDDGQTDCAIEKIIQDALGLIQPVFDGWNTELQKEDRLCFYEQFLRALYLGQLISGDSNATRDRLKRIACSWDLLYRQGRLRYSFFIDFYQRQLLKGSADGAGERFRGMDWVTMRTLDLPSRLKLNIMMFLSGQYSVEDLSGDPIVVGRNHLLVSPAYLGYLLFIQKIELGCPENEILRLIPLLL